MVVNAGGKAFVLDTTGYDPDSMTASGNSHVMTLNGTVKLGGASGTIIVKNGNAGKTAAWCWARPTPGTGSTR